MIKSSFSYKMRQSLSDITNSQSQEEEISLAPSEHLNRLMKENVALVKLLEERDKTIELSRYELRNLREGMHKLQLQNWSLAQCNSQFLAEINLSRNKVKALHHEVTCKSALLKVKCYEQEVQKSENTQPRRNALTNENMLKIADEESAKPSVPNRRRFIRTFGASSAHKTEATKRRQSRRKSSAQEETENLFEIEDLQLTMPNDMCLKSHTPKKEEEIQDLKRRDILRKHDSKVYRSSVDRSLHRAAERIHSYNEGSLITKI